MANKRQATKEEAELLLQAKDTLNNQPVPTNERMVATELGITKIRHRKLASIVGWDKINA